MYLAEMAGQLWKSQRGMLVLVVILLIMNLVLFVAVDQVLVPRVTAQETLFLQQQAELRALRHKQGGAAGTPEQIFVLASQDASRFRQAIPDYEEFTGLIEELLVLSNRARLDITRISYAPEELKEAPLLKFNLNFNVAGDYEQIKKFIHSMEQSVRLLVIKQITLQNSDEKDVTLQLNLETYFRPGSRES
jgi:type IV pilus assembly protein PilO